MKRSDISTLTVLLGCKKAHAKHDCMSFETIYELQPAPEKVIYAAMEREDDKGLLEWGVSLHTAWLTSEGEKILQELLANQ